LTEHDDVRTPLLRWAPRLGLTFVPTFAKAGTACIGDSLRPKYNSRLWTWESGSKERSPQ